jgi:hypothetical protein
MPAIVMRCTASYLWTRRLLNQAIGNVTAKTMVAVTMPSRADRGIAVPAPQAVAITIGKIHHQLRVHHEDSLVHGRFHHETLGGGTLNDFDR